MTGISNGIYTEYGQGFPPLINQSIRRSTATNDKDERETWVMSTKNVCENPDGSEEYYTATNDVDGSQADGGKMRSKKKKEKNKKRKGRRDGHVPLCCGLGRRRKDGEKGCPDG